MRKFIKVCGVLLVMAVAIVLMAQQPVVNSVLSDVWDSTNHWLKVSLQNTSLPLPTGASTAANQTATQPRNVAQIAGTATSVNRGSADAGTQRVIQPAVTPVLENALSTTVQTVNGSAAYLDSYYCWNPNSSVAYVQIFDISGTVTLGTSTPKWSIGIPPTGGANLSGMNLTFANAIKAAATTTATGSTAPTTAIDCNFGVR